MLVPCSGYALAWVVVVWPGTARRSLVYGLLSGPVFLAFLAWFWIRVYYLPVPALMLEPVGVSGAIGRGSG